MDVGPGTTGMPQDAAYGLKLSQALLHTATHYVVPQRTLSEPRGQARWLRGRTGSPGETGTHRACNNWINCTSQGSAPCERRLFSYFCAATKVTKSSPGRRYVENGTEAKLQKKRRAPSPPHADADRLGAADELRALRHAPDLAGELGQRHSKSSSAGIAKMLYDQSSG